jgi:uncharacterized membrane protein
MSKSRHNNPLPHPSSDASSIATITHQSASFSGPLPHPAILARYNEVIPNGAERIMAMAERQSIHRESLEAQVVAGNVTSQARGSLYAFILCLVTIVGGFVLVGMGKSVIGVSSIVGSLATLAGVFILSKREQGKERSQKQDALLTRTSRSS